MKIGIVGSGNIGSTAARLFIEAGHDVAVSNSRGPDTLRALIVELGVRARALTVNEAARFGDVVLIAIPFGKYKDLPAEALTGKIVIDAGNYYPERDGHFAALDLGKTTSSELVAEHLPGTRVVKAFNTIYYKDLAEQGDTNLSLENRRAIFMAGDDPAAKATVARLIEEIGFAPIDLGGLHEGGRRQQPGTPVYNKNLNQRQAETFAHA
ncbi:MAG: NADP oxidoreductase [Nitrospira sp. SG-bin1]|nr:MAG: NADP oxidoreductase [Nitrospira sp. SG-bin1]